jgi:hypothetical protein
VLDVLVLVVLLAVILGVPFYLAGTSRRRGVGGSLPRHPFRLPTSGSWSANLPPMETPQDYLDIPPIEEPGDRRRRPGGRRRIRR